MLDLTARCAAQLMAPDWSLSAGMMASCIYTEVTSSPHRPMKRPEDRLSEEDAGTGLLDRWVLKPLVDQPLPVVEQHIVQKWVNQGLLGFLSFGVGFHTGDLRSCRWF